ncbi:uncharacterized protein STEHIDRAFT_163134 [Stereum hirsutum FP-91666 SS1]|uniref:DUF6534 domain-containing protein n=1 Tax=Stereum hirsutum (strain FP-91666) TaxID=721885 RepID=R7RYI3_STEHR|nr:uncharacterized protein STEHIDRAFT_163134 [Stereum hirsutum FP-91666 SS1]EIM79878.1 hypothetical protein STEHIDRAFT_163134 [Stereum hirsutum FP-91666 SS1]
MSSASDLRSAIENTLGYQLIGAFIAAAMYGVTVLQTYIYWIRFAKKDSRKLRSLVIFIWGIDTVCSALVCASLYKNLVQDWGVLDSLESVPVTFALENGFTCFVTVVVQCFFAHRVWLVSGKQSKIIPVVIAIFALVGFGGGCALTARMFITNLNLQVVETDVFINNACIVDQTAAAACDILITLSLYYYLNLGRRKDSLTRRADSVLQSLVIYFISRGILTTVFQILAVATYAGLRSQQLWIIWQVCLSKAYVNSLLAILNAREYLSKTLNGPDNMHTISELRFDCGPATNSTGITGSSHATGGAAIELGTGSQNDQGDQEKEIKFSNPTPPKSQSSFSRV